MKKAILLILPLAIALAICPVSCAGEGSRTYNWYVKRNANHQTPTIDSCFSFIDNCSAFYVDKKTESKKLYLTFDVGYENGNTKKIMDVVQSEGVPAAFFVLSHFVEKNTDLVIRMQEEGHLVCNHTAKHKDMSKVSQNEFAKELKTMETLVLSKTQKPLSKFYRPPRGTFSEENLKWAEELGYKTVFWSLCYADWDNNKQPDPEYATQLLLENTHPGAIILLHPTSATNAQILRDLICKWKSEGYQFASLNEI